MERQYLEYKSLIQNELQKYFDEYKKNSSYSSTVWESMAYTTLLDGKRLRAIMTLETGKILGELEKNLLPAACSTEIMHAYSLIHDDLPCMDDDDMRRGKPSNHKVFGEAIATLAGDALIPFGAQVIIEKTPETTSKEIVYDIVKDYLKTAGALGIVAGQVADIEAENKKIEIENLEYIHKFKTAALFKYAILAGAKIAKANDFIIQKLSCYADNFGMVFQIHDDIIDCLLTTDELGKTAGKDAKSNKTTFASFYGINKSKEIFYSLIDKNYGILNELGVKSPMFSYIYEMLIKKVEK